MGEKAGQFSGLDGALCVCFAWDLQCFYSNNFQCSSGMLQELGGVSFISMVISILWSFLGKDTLYYKDTIAVIPKRPSGATVNSQGCQRMSWVASSWLSWALPSWIMQDLAQVKMVVPRRARKKRLLELHTEMMWVYLGLESTQLILRMHFKSKQMQSVTCCCPRREAFVNYERVVGLCSPF